MKEQIILASASPRRQQLLAQIGIGFIIHAVDIDETVKTNESVEQYVKRVAAEKSDHCQSVLNSHLPVLAADTSVEVSGKILGKPENREHALAMLTELSGNVHYVYSSVSLRCAGQRKQNGHFQALSKTQVQFKKISRQEIEAYWATGEPQGKAGAYAIQGLASIFVESIRGSYTGVVGLPLFETAELLSKQGINVIT